MTAANTPIATFQDILDAMARNPELEAEMRRHLQDEELRNLPQTVARLAQSLEELTAIVTAMVERQDRMEADIAELKDGQTRMEADIAELKDGQTRMQADIAELKDGHAELKDGHAELKDGQTRMEADIAELKDGYAELKDGQADLKDGQTRMQGTLNRLSGADYERRIARSLRRNALNYFGIRNARLIHSVILPNNNALPDLMDQAFEAGIITAEEAGQVERVDLAIDGHNDDGDACYVIIEASITVNIGDVTRARDRSRIIARATGNHAIPATVGAAIRDDARRYAAEQGVITITISEE